jgi:hypothetical protein
MTSTKKPLIDFLLDREIGQGKFSKTPSLSKATQRKIDNSFGGVRTFVATLKSAIAENKWDNIEFAVGDIIVNLLDNAGAASNNYYSVSQQKKLNCECFVECGGVELMLELFTPPFVSDRDARNFVASEVRLKSEVWNEILVILREVSYAVQSVSQRWFKTEQMVFLFSLLSQQPVFDNTMNLLEEILAVREDTFLLMNVPNFYSLVGKFSARQLAHFCRLLSLVIFEPEDRQALDHSHVLHSTELLQLRKNRMSRNLGGAVEKNQVMV